MRSLSLCRFLKKYSTLSQTEISMLRYHLKNVSPPSRRYFFSLSLPCMLDQMGIPIYFEYNFQLFHEFLKYVSSSPLRVRRLVMPESNHILYQLLLLLSNILNSLRFHFLLLQSIHRWGFFNIPSGSEYKLCINIRNYWIIDVFL